MGLLGDCWFLIVRVSKILLKTEELPPPASGRPWIFLDRQYKVNYNLRVNSLTFKWLGSVKHAIIMPILNVNFNHLEYFLDTHMCVCWFQSPLVCV